MSAEDDAVQAAVQAAFDKRGFVLAADIIDAYAAVGESAQIRSQDLFNLGARNAAGVIVPLLPTWVRVDAIGVSVLVWVHCDQTKRPSEDDVGEALVQHIRGE